ncbi:cupin domain-containing protein [Streptomyces sp. NPDC002143]
MTTEVDGRSRVLTDSPAPQTWCEEIWATSVKEPLGSDPGAEPQPLDPPAGSTYFRLVELPPEAVIREAMAAAGADLDVDGEGFHKTNSIDYVVVLDGPVELVLDEETVVVQPGEVVVQRATNHAWRNQGSQSIRLLVVMTSIA